MRVVVIGMGGVGSYLINPLARYLDTLKGEENHCLILVDGDKYEPKNMTRQDVSEDDIGANKAVAQMTRIARVFSSI